jgi:Amt family ammonium transporter
MGGVSVISQIIGTLVGVTIALVGGVIVYGLIKKMVGIRLDAESEFDGADLSIHKIPSVSGD